MQYSPSVETPWVIRTKQSKRVNKYKMSNIRIITSVVAIHYYPNSKAWDGNGMMVNLTEYAWKDAAKCDPRGSLLQYMGAITKKSCQSTLRLSTISILHNASKGDDKVIVAQCSCSQVDTLKTNYFLIFVFIIQNKWHVNNLLKVLISKQL